MGNRRTPFHEKHVEAGGRIVPFAGFDMPVQYSGLIEEHTRVREAVGLFDVSHMGEVRFRGPRALDAVQYLVSNDVTAIPDGKAQYNCICNHGGGVVDDTVVYRLAADDLILCVNAANRAKDFAWMVDSNPHPDGAGFTDQGDDWGQVAVQGRNAVATLQKLTDVDLSSVAFYWHAAGTVAGVAGCILARTGYTGEDGFEVFAPADRAADLWPALMEAGAEFGIVPVGLGARDTLRLEANMCLYGNDIDKTTNPLEARLGWVTKLAKPDFVGKQAIVAAREQGLKRRQVSMVVEKRIARPHSTIVVDGQPVGEVTSGTRAPYLEVNIALGYVPRRYARPGTRLQIDIRGKLADAEVVKPPFFKRDY